MRANTQTHEAHSKWALRRAERLTLRCDLAAEIPVRISKRQINDNKTNSLKTPFRSVSQSPRSAERGSASLSTHNHNIPFACSIAFCAKLLQFPSAPV